MKQQIKIGRDKDKNEPTTWRKKRNTRKIEYSEKASPHGVHVAASEFGATDKVRATMRYHAAAFTSLSVAIQKCNAQKKII